MKTFFEVAIQYLGFSMIGLLIGISFYILLTSPVKYVPLETHPKKKPKKYKRIHLD
jgi:hypothetical protein